MHNWDYCTTFVGHWDVMSAHLVRKGEPPPGISSFTRIRLGWIKPDQVLMVSPGQTTRATLSPLEKKGKNLAVKIPLSSGQYYLLENRQPIGFDRVLPDSGLLILKVNPNAVEGTGTVKVLDADPGSPNLTHATYRPDREGRRLFVDKENNLAILSVGYEGEDLTLLITTPGRASVIFK